MTDIIKAAKKLIDCVEFDMNGAGGKGGNGGLLSDTTLRAAHDLRVIMSREAVSAWKTMDTAPRNGTVIQAWHTVHKCPISILWNANGHDFNGETLHWFERSYTTVWPEHVFSHWMPLPSQPTTKGGAA